uniref:PHD-type domain-containing protein n=1 Tax=Clastoptera arizonana TaxID=38151 RepID=A0A1B6E5E4_9HEMI
MSGQYPHPNATSQFSRQHGPPHHLPPAPAGQYCPPQGPSQRIHSTPQHWPHPTHNTGLNTVGGGLVYGSPHLSGYGIPSRNQPWPKPSENRYALPSGGGNSMYNLQMQLPPVVESRLTGDYNQEETIDLSSHSISVERRDKDLLKNGDMLENPVVKSDVGGKITGSVVNGESGESSSFKSETHFSEKDASVSVIAHNPLSDILNCSKSEKMDCDVNKNEDSSAIAECSGKQLATELNQSQSSMVLGYSNIRSHDFFKKIINTDIECPKALISESLSVKSPEFSDTKCIGNVGLRSSEIFSDSGNMSCTSVNTSENLSIRDTNLQVPEMFNLKNSDNTIQPSEYCSQNNLNINLQHQSNIKNVDNIYTDPFNAYVLKNKVDGLTSNITEPITTNIDKTSSNDASSVEPFTNLSLSSDSNTKPIEKINEGATAAVVADNSLLNISKFSENIGNKENDVPDTLYEKSTEIKNTVALEDSVPKSDCLQNITKMSTDWESPNHTAENVESILENMFNTQEDSSIQTSKSVIVNNETKPLLDDLSIEKPKINLPMKEEDLAKTLLEETHIKEEKHEKMDTTNSISGSVNIDVKDENVEMHSKIDEIKDNVPDTLVDPIPDQSSILNPVLEDEKQSRNPTESTHLEVTTNINSEKNPFIEVESELEKMFAGIVEPTDQANNESKISSAAEMEIELKKTFINKRSVNRRKANGRKSFDNNMLVSEGKKRNKRMSDGDGRKIKKPKLESGWDSPSGKKGKSFQKDISNDSGSGVNKSKGPFIHIEGFKENPVNVIVVNSGVRPEDEEGSEKAISRRKHSNYQRTEGRCARSRGAGLYSSTLSSRYDAHTADTTWICVFCKQGPHCEGGLGGQPAGDLFGPYRISSIPPDDLLSSISDKDIVEEQKKRGGGKQQSLRASGGADSFIQKMARKNKRLSLDEPESVLGMTLIPGETKDSGYEVWTHEQCATWAPGVYIVGSKLVGIEEAVWAAAKTICNQCGDTGAGLGCVIRNCTPRVHYGCALLCSWHLDQDTYIAKCNHHRTRYLTSGMLRPS